MSLPTKDMCFVICEAYYVYAMRFAMTDTKNAILARLERIKFRPGLAARRASYNAMSDEHKAIIRKLWIRENERMS